MFPMATTDKADLSRIRRLRLCLAGWAGAGGALKLLFDANLSPKLVHRLAELFPDSVHVFDTGLARFTSDEAIWEYARAQGFTIVTADSDFPDLARSRGTPPMVVRLENCNYRASQVEDHLRRHAILIADLEQSSRATRHPKHTLTPRCRAASPEVQKGVTFMWNRSTVPSAFMGIMSVSIWRVKPAGRSQDDMRAHTYRSSAR